MHFRSCGYSREKRKKGTQSLSYGTRELTLKKSYWIIKQTGVEMEIVNEFEGVIIDFEEACILLLTVLLIWQEGPPKTFIL